MGNRTVVGALNGLNAWKVRLMKADYWYTEGRGHLIVAVDAKGKEGRDS